MLVASLKQNENRPQYSKKKARRTGGLLESGQ